jgi:hypothetical protein
MLPELLPIALVALVVAVAVVAFVVRSSKRSHEGVVVITVDRVGADAVRFDAGTRAELWLAVALRSAAPPELRDVSEAVDGVCASLRIEDIEQRSEVLEDALVREISRKIGAPVESVRVERLVRVS